MGKIYLTQSGLLPVTAFGTTVAALVPGIVPAVQLTGAKKNFRYEDNKVTDIVDAVSYTVLVPELAGQLTIKVPNATTLIVPQKQLESGEEIFVNVNFDNVWLRPYAIEKGSARFTATCSPADISLVS